jgi:hypothetical protein
MLNGCPPPNAKKELLREFKKEFYDKGMIEKKYLNFLSKVIDIWRDYEHGKIQEISGTKIDKLLKETEEYLKRLKELRIEIEKKYQEKTIENVYKDLMDLLKKILGNKSKEKLLQAFEGTLVSTGEFTKQHLRILNDVLKSYNDFKKGKTNANKINRARGDADILMKALVEYAQRKELLPIEKGKVKLKFNDKIIELMNLNENIYFYDGEEIKKVTNKIESSSEEEFRKDFEKQKNKKENSLDPKIFDVLRKEYGEFKIDLL